MKFFEDLNLSFEICFHNEKQKYSIFDWTAFSAFPRIFASLSNLMIYPLWVNCPDYVAKYEFEGSLIFTSLILTGLIFLFFLLFRKSQKCHLLVFAKSG